MSIWYLRLELSISVNVIVYPPPPKKAQMRKKSKNIEQKPIKQVIKLNSYRHVDKILDFIDNSENLSKNLPIYNHFTNIKYKKKMDEMNRRILNKSNW